MPEIPPWMNVSPLAPVPMYLQGFGQGAQIGESRRRAEMVAYEQQLQQQAQQERNEILREARQIQAQEFAQTLKLKQDEAARSARQAAEQLEGRRGFERDVQLRISQGMEPAEAMRQSLPLHASKLFAGQEQSLAQVLGQMKPKEYAPSELERSMQYALGQGFITKEEAPTLAREHFLGPTESMEMTTDESGRPVYRMTKGRGAAMKQAGAPTVAFQTKLQEQLHSYDNSMALLSHVEQNMNQGDFGLRGMAKELKTRIGGQFGLDVPPEQLDVRNTLKQLRSDLFKALRSDSNIAEAERKNIEKMIPEVEMFDVMESLPNAVGKLVTVKRTLMERSRTAAQRLGVPPPMWTMTAPEIKALVQAGKMDPNEAVRAMIQYNIQIPAQ